MTCKTAIRKRSTSPSLDNFVTSFFNTAIGDVILPSTTQYSNPSTNVIKLDDKYILEIALPGFSKEDVDIHIERDVLTVSDRREITEGDNSSKYRLREFNFVGFSKSYHVPDYLDIDKVSASFDSGVLTISLGKKDEALPKEPKKINIQ